MPLTLYLGLEGVAFAKRDCIRLSRGELADQRVEPLPLLQTLAAIVSREAELAIVLNSWLVADYGYRTILSHLPKEIACRTVGATMQGNRSHRRRVTLPRVELLRSDISRRMPASFVIVDSVPSAIPYEYLEQAVIVDGSAEEAQVIVAEKIAQFLSANTDEPYSDGDSRQERPPPRGVLHSTLAGNFGAAFGVVPCARRGGLFVKLCCGAYENSPEAAPHMEFAISQSKLSIAISYRREKGVNWGVIV